MTICGLIAHYGDEDGVDSRAELMKLAGPQLKARGVVVKNLFVGDFAADHTGEMLAYVAPLVKAGKIRYREDIRQGVDAIPTSFAEMLRGDNFGKMLVQLSPDPTLGQA